MLLLLSCKDTSPCVFSFSFCFCFPSLSSLLSIYVLLLSSFSFSPLFFFLSLSFFFCPFFALFSLSSPISSTLSSPVFIGKKQGERGLLPLSSRGIGIGWPRQPPQGCPRGSSPLFFRLVVGHGSEFKQVMGLLSASFWVFSEKGGKGQMQGKTILLPLPLRVQGKKKTHSAVQNGII